MSESMMGIGSLLLLSVGVGVERRSGWEADINMYCAEVNWLVSREGNLSSSLNENR